METLGQELQDLQAWSRVAAECEECFKLMKIKVIGVPECCDSLAGKLLSLNEGCVYSMQICSLVFVLATGGCVEQVRGVQSEPEIL